LICGHQTKFIINQKHLLKKLPTRDPKQCGGVGRIMYDNVEDDDDDDDD